MHIYHNLFLPILYAHPLLRICVMNIYEHEFLLIQWRLCG